MELMSELWENSSNAESLTVLWTITTENKPGLYYNNNEIIKHFAFRFVLEWNIDETAVWMCKPLSVCAPPTSHHNIIT